MGELERVGQQVLDDLLQPLRVGEHRLRQARVEREARNPRLSTLPCAGRCARRRCCSSSAAPRRRPPATVPDSILDRSRMSLISISRSLPDEWMVFANSTCLAVRLPCGLVHSWSGQDQQAVERRAQLVRHVGQELGLVLGGERELRAPFPPAPGAPARLRCSCAPPPGSGAPAGAPFLQLLVGLLQLFLPAAQLLRERLRLLEQVFRAHVGFDRVDHDADTLGELLRGTPGASGRSPRTTPARARPSRCPRTRSGRTRMLRGAASPSPLEMRT